MFDWKKKKANAPQPIHTLLREGTLWKGDIHSGSNSLRIECTLEGTIHSEGEVTVAPSGVVKGTIHAKHLIVTGRVEGTFKISDCLEIHGTGWVDGDAEVGSLLVDEGGTLQGSCTRMGMNKAKEEPEAVKSKLSKKEKRAAAWASQASTTAAGSPSQTPTPSWDLASSET
jgi:cytoskeletal protein CcmA (bactofilin family)